jgi:predicted unusual protein kinase regulating ubiquinone biosynthesis (AarF/ABC1/UbiB family)
MVFLLRKILPYKWADALLQYTNRRAAKRIKRYIFRLRGLYIKLGQFLGMMTNLFMREFIEQLARLQDRVPPVPYKVIKQRFISQWGKEPTQIFHLFNKEPIAAASLGQVHIAKLEDGTKLAVKALYPDIENLVEKDLYAVKSISGLVQFFFPYFDMNILYNEFADMVKKEVNYEKEKENIEIFRKNFEHEKDFVFPVVIEKYSCKTILTLEYINGIKINDIQTIKNSGMSPEKVSRNLVRAYCKMIFNDQFFHADPHPGNFFVLPGHKIAFVDFGAVETVSTRIKLIIRNLARSIITKDIPKIVENLDELGMISRKADYEQIENMIAYRYDKLSNLKIESYKDLNFRDFNELEDLKALDLRLSEIMHYYQIPNNLLLLGRTITLLSGLAVDLNPRLNLFQIAWPYLKDFVFGSDKSIPEFINENALPFIKSTVSLPEYALKTMNTINSGKIKVTLKDFTKDVKKIYRLGHQIIYTLFIIAFLAFGIVFFLNNKVQFAKYCAYAAGAFSFFLVISFHRNRKF